MHLWIILLVCLQLWIIVEPKTIEIDIGTGCRPRRECRRSCRRSHCCCDDDDSSRGHRRREKYFISDFTTTWHGAKEYCEDRKGMKLLDASDRVLSDDIVRAIKKSGPCHSRRFWTREKKYSSWMGRKVCLYVEYYHNKEDYIEGSCERKRHFICERR